MVGEPHKELPNPEHPASNTNQGHQSGDTPIQKIECQIPPAIIDKYQSNQSKQNRRERWKLCVEVATLVVVSFYAAMAWIQACEMKNATEATRNSLTILRLQQRPWVHHVKNGLDPSNLYGKDVKKRQPINAWIQVNNTGSSPALHAKVLAEWFVDIIDADMGNGAVHAPKECGLDNIPTTYKGRPLKELPLFPGTVNDGVAYQDNILLSDSDLSAIKNDKKTLFMTGCVFYSDGAGTRYRTQICMKYTPDNTMLKYSKRDPFGYFDNSVYRYCLTGNYTEHTENGKYVRD